MEEPISMMELISTLFLLQGCSSFPMTNFTQVKVQRFYTPDDISHEKTCCYDILEKDGHCSDYSNYLDAKGDADIFFPTDFSLWECMDHYCSGWLKLHEDE